MGASSGKETIDPSNYVRPGLNENDVMKIWEAYNALRGSNKRVSLNQVKQFNPHYDQNPFEEPSSRRDRGMSERDIGGKKFSAFDDEHVLAYN